jgi:hypothetical protein
MHAVLGAAAMTAVAFAAPTTASTLYEQAGSGEACNTSCWTTVFGNDIANGFLALDNFTLTSNATVVSVAWDGFYYDFRNPGNNPVAPTTTQWGIYLYADNAGLPDFGTPVGFWSVGSTEVTTTLLAGSSFSGNPVNLFHFELTLPTSVALTGGTQYWFAPLSIADEFNPIFSWSPAAVDVDGLTVQYQIDPLTQFIRPNDRAFALFGSDVPEPASWAMMIAGFGLTGAAMRRRRVAAAIA